MLKISWPYFPTELSATNFTDFETKKFGYHTNFLILWVGWWSNEARFKILKIGIFPKKFAQSFIHI